MCDPISIGIAIGASMGALSAAATGGDVLQGALIGGVTGAFTGGTGGLGAGSTSSALGGSLGASTSTSLFASVGSSVTTAGALGFGALSLGGGLLMGLLTPKTPDIQLGAQQQQQDFSGGQIRTTGSGGSQAAISLAGAITRSKKRKLTQDDVSDLSIDTSSFAAQGLQLA